MKKFFTSQNIVNASMFILNAGLFFCGASFFMQNVVFKGVQFYSKLKIGVFKICQKWGVVKIFCCVHSIIDRFVFSIIPDPPSPPIHSWMQISCLKKQEPIFFENDLFCPFSHFEKTPFSYFEKNYSLNKKWNILFLDFCVLLNIFKNKFEKTLGVSLDGSSRAIHFVGNPCKTFKHDEDTYYLLTMKINDFFVFRVINNLVSDELHIITSDDFVETKFQKIMTSIKRFTENYIEKTRDLYALFHAAPVLTPQVEDSCLNDCETIKDSFEICDILKKQRKNSEEDADVDSDVDSDADVEEDLDSDTEEDSDSDTKEEDSDAKEEVKDSNINLLGFFNFLDKKINAKEEDSDVEEEEYEEDFEEDSDTEEEEYEEDFEEDSDTKEEEKKEDFEEDSDAKDSAEEEEDKDECNDTKEELCVGKNICFEKSNVKFILIEYISTSHSSKTIQIKLPSNYFIVGNELLSNTFIMKYMKQHIGINPFTRFFDLNYKINIVDNEINSFVLNQDEYIRLGKDTYSVCKL